MNAYSEAFYRYIQEHPLKYNDAEVESVLELSTNATPRALCGIRRK